MWDYELLRKESYAVSNIGAPNTDLHIAALLCAQITKVFRIILILNPFTAKFADKLNDSAKASHNDSE